MDEQTAPIDLTTEYTSRGNIGARGAVETFKDVAAVSACFAVAMIIIYANLFNNEF